MRREATATATATATTVRRHLGEFLNQVQYRGDSIVVTRDGKPVAALVGYALYERINRLRESFAALTDKLGHVYAAVPAVTAEAEINAAIRNVRLGSRRPPVAVREARASRSPTP